MRSLPAGSCLHKDIGILKQDTSGVPGLRWVLPIYMSQKPKRPHFLLYKLSITAVDWGIVKREGVRLVGRSLNPDQKAYIIGNTV